MSVPALGRLQRSPGRRANRRGLLLEVLGTFLVLLMAGCRSVGTTTSDAKSPSANDELPAKRPILSRALLRSRSNNSQLDSTSQSVSQNEKTSRETSDEEDATVVQNDAEQNQTNGTIAKITRPIDRAAQTAGFEFDDAADDSAIEVAGFRDEPSALENHAQRNSTDPKSLNRISDAPFKETSITVPPEIPGASAPRYHLPPRTDDDDLVGRANKFKVIDLLFPKRAEPAKIAEPTDRTMTLEELEEIALENNPILAQALAAVTISQGAAIQVSMYPNPSGGYEADTVGSTGTRNYQGINIQQPIKTAGKLPLARSVANFDVMNSQLAYERTKLEVLRSVRSGYFNVLVAQRTIRFNEAFERMTRQVFEAMKERLKGGEHPAFELNQYNASVNQARAAVVQAQNRYISAWKQLAVATGIPQLKPAALDGRADMPVPNLDYSVLLDRALSVHPDLYAARNLEQQAQTQVRLQRAMVIPDVTVGGAFQNDFTSPGFNRTSYNLNVTVPLPLFDRNQGNIKSALGRLKMMSMQNSVKTMELTDQLADAFERFQTGRYEAEAYRTQILPDQVRAYEGNYSAYISDNSEVAFGDIILAQQNLSTGVAMYVTFLLQQWIALTDIANVIQLRDFRELLHAGGQFSSNSDNLVPSPVPQEGAQP